MTPKILALAVFGLALSACSGSQLARTESTPAAGSAFENELYAEYLKLARLEYQEADYKDSDVFALRAANAAKGAAAGPEEISARQLPTDAIGELTDARARLSGALRDGAAAKLPQAAAQAQTAFDCWMQEQEENIQPADIAACRAAFLVAMGDVEDGMKPQLAAAEPAPAPAPVEPQEFVVFFDFGESELTGAAQSTLRDAVAFANSIDGAKLVIAGHADRAGDVAFNQTLAQSRAETVVTALRGEGVVGGDIRLAAFGESQPAVATNDGVAEAGNRRVSIIVGE